MVEREEPRRGNEGTNKHVQEEEKQRGREPRGEGVPEVGDGGEGCRAEERLKVEESDGEGEKKREEEEKLEGGEEGGRAEGLGRSELV